ncbi:hypothetical protein [Halanaerobium]|jgi:hypothetical protein|uniref:Uncharacterized protein n=2 Tax=Halanaerobium TaxID=2330 RepID=A0A1M7L9Z3_9FIRM|nr:hypothetical protein [Halanaerobium]PXV63229.1 hypothetical protein C8C78_1259 [Halanaerobium congolense]TDQ00110.1 hypothetical protein C7957_104111 [Halanaerobium saccharolyticum]SHM74922.1 hypothetical protein SAMN04515650_10797 [Halanaerobium congolense]
MFKNKIFIVLIALLLVAGIYSAVGAHSGSSNNNMMGNGYNGQMNGFNNYPDNNQGNYGMMGPNGMMGMMGRGMGYGGMMRGYGQGTNRNIDYSLSALGMTEEEVKDLAVELVDRQFGSDYQISDIFIFNDSPYYISVVEKDSDQGVFELLFDPYRKVIYPEYGPNMMWNTENGMSYMMGWSAPVEENMMPRQEVLENAEKFAQANDFMIEDEGHQFPGYYTFHTADTNDNTTGMLSVNSYTGQVWYHNWHGDLAEVISVKEHQE